MGAIISFSGSPPGQISEYGWQAAADFLSGFTSIFTGVDRTDTTWDNDRPPEIYFARADTGEFAFFDRHGNKNTDAPWVSFGSGQTLFGTDIPLTPIKPLIMPDDIYTAMHEMAWSLLDD
jgi:hypothetical protein